MKRTKTLKVRLTEDGYDYLVEKAKEHGFGSVSELTRYALNVYLGDTFQALQDTLATIDGIPDDSQYQKMIRSVKVLPIPHRLFRVRRSEDTSMIALHGLSRQQRRAAERQARKSQKRVATKGKTGLTNH